MAVRSIVVKKPLVSMMARPQTKFHGPNQPVRYQTGSDTFLEETLEGLAEKIEQYALPELARWQQLAAQIMPRIEGLAVQDPEGYEEMKLWTKQKARRWREEISRLPAFVEEWDSSQYLRDCVFSWFIHAFSLHP
ncbi:MAG: hypothetical protein HFF44_06740 [Lawsonibacter sp.]|nr:hypothetical protein [Lawsonibacter sp.]